jgi:predicted enzyme related to lactoylglutathione lyase
MGAKPSWMGYVWVEDVDKAPPKLTAAGGAVFKAPADIPGVGRFAVVADPDGATFMLFRDAGGEPPPPPPPGTPGLVGWRELHAGDGASAFAFYSDQFGWKKERDYDMGPMGVYHTFDTGDGQHGGVFTKTPQTPAPFWLDYFLCRRRRRGRRARQGARRVGRQPADGKAQRPMDRSGARSARRDVRARRAEAMKPQSGPCANRRPPTARPLP